MGKQPSSKETTYRTCGKKSGRLVLATYGLHVMVLEKYIPSLRNNDAIVDYLKL